MQILFLYSSESPLFKGQNLNFGGPYLFKYDKEKQIFTVIENPQYIKDFFVLDPNNDSVAAITNLSALVGQNGAGKSTVLEYFREHFTGNSGPRTSFILALTEKEKIFVYHTEDIPFANHNLNDFEIKLTTLKVVHTSTQYVDKEVIYRESVDLPAFKNTTFVHFSNVFDGKPNYQTADLKDISTNYLVYNDFRHDVDAKIISRDDIDMLEAHWQNEIERQIDFINFYKKDNPVNFKLPERLTITARRKLSSFEHQYGSKQKRKIKERGFEELVTILLSMHHFTEDRPNNADPFKRYFKRAALANFIDDMIFNTEGILTDHYLFSESQNLKLNSPDDIFRYLHNGLSAISETSELASYCLNTLNKINILFNDLDNLINDDTLIFHSEGQAFNIGLDKKKFDEFYSNYKETYISKPYLNFDWPGVSSGEKAYLNILSRFYAISDKFLKTDETRVKDNMIILIDEGDVYLHPEWQRQFSFILLKYLPVIFAKPEGPQRNIQIIFSTNSPIPISDIPNSNIVFLRKAEDQTIVLDSLEDKKLTFGANIHTLLSDSFFLNNGVIGEFAKNKINSVIELLQGKKEDIMANREMLERSITMIGEPIIRTKLAHMLVERLQMNMMDIDSRISNLEKEIEILKQQKPLP